MIIFLLLQIEIEVIGFIMFHSIIGIERFTAYPAVMTVGNVRFCL
jgi:hypothetical protein